MAVGDPTMRFVEYGDLPNAQPYPRRAPKDADVKEEDDDETDGSDRPDTEGVDEASAEELPPLRSRDYTPGHRQVKAKPVITAGPSPWERPRDGFTASMTERVPEMRATKQAGYVKGTTREA